MPMKYHAQEQMDMNDSYIYLALCMWGQANKEAKVDIWTKPAALSMENLIFNLLIQHLVMWHSTSAVFWDYPNKSAGNIFII